MAAQAFTNESMRKKSSMRCKGKFGHGKWMRLIGSNRACKFALSNLGSKHSSALTMVEDAVSSLEDDEHLNAGSTTFQTSTLLF
jgi:isoaspartyl peptidase/L-asparaginase-like protein (Ntn-hydrolase superfamily)